MTKIMWYQTIQIYQLSATSFEEDGRMGFLRQPLPLPLPLVKFTSSTPDL